MNKTKRLFCAIVAVLMLIPLSLVGVSAEAVAVPDGAVLMETDYGEKPVSIDSLGWKHTGGAYGDSKAKFKNLTLGIIPGLTEGSQAALKLSGTADMAPLQMVSAETMKAALKDTDGSYTVNMKAAVDYVSSDWFGLCFGNQQTDMPAAHGDWVFARGTWMTLQSYVNGSGKDGVSVEANYPKQRVFDWTIEMNPAAKTMKVYIDGTLEKEYTTFVSEIGAIHWIFYFSASGSANNNFKPFEQARVDDIKVVKGDRTQLSNADAVIYSEDFESYAASANELAKIPAGGKYATGPKGIYSIVNKYNDTYLNISEPMGDGGQWISNGLISADTLKGVDRFTLRFDMLVDYSKYQGTNSWIGRVGFTFGGKSTGDCNWINIYSGSIDGTLRDRIAMGVSDPAGPGGISEYARVDFGYRELMGSRHSYALEVDYAAKTAKLYMDDFTTPVAVEENIWCDKTAPIEFEDRGPANLFVDDILLTAGTLADHPTKLAGVQETAVADGKYDVRFLGILNGKEYTDYSAVGFHIQAAYGDNQMKNWDVSCKAVYSTILANGGAVEKSAVGLGGKYIYACTVRGVPQAAGRITFKVTPYFTAKGSTEAVGTSYTVVYENGVCLGMTVTN